MARDYNIRPSEKFLQAWIDEFLKQNNAEKWIDVNKHQRYRFIKDVIPRIRQFEKDTKGLVRRQELAKLLGVDNDYLRAISKSADYGPTGKPNVRYRIFQDLIGPSKKIYRPVTGKNEGFYKKPTKAAIEAFKKANRSSTILPVMTERVNAFINREPFMKMLRTKDLTDPDFLKKTQALFPKLNLTDQKVADGILYIARGAKGDEFLGATIKKDLPLHKRLIKQFESSKWGNPLHAAAYKFARTEIDQQLGTKEGTFRTYQTKLSQALKDLGIKNFKNYEVDEFVGTSIGGKQKVGPYSVFSRYVSEAVNAGPGAAYQGELSRKSITLNKILQGNKEVINNYVGTLENTLKRIKQPSFVNKMGWDKARVDWIKNNYPNFIKQIESNPKKAANFFVQDFNKTIAGVFEKKHGIGAARLDLGMPKEVFGARRYKELGTLGEQMTEVVKEKGFGYKLPKGALTQKEALIKLASRNVGGVCQLFRNKGGRIGFAAGSSCAAEMSRALDENPIQVVKNIRDLPGKTGALNQVKNAATTFLGMLGRGGVKAAPYAAIAAAGAAIEPLVKQFRSDDPTTYLSDENQQKGMLLSMIEAETPKVDEEILKWQMPALGAATAAGAIPGAKTLYQERRGVGPKGPLPKGVGKTRAALGLSGVLGKALGASFSPLVVGATLPFDIAAQRKGGSDWADIATSPGNWMGPAFMGSGYNIASKGIVNPTLLKLLRFGISRSALAAMGPVGWAGLAGSLGLAGYDMWKNRGSKKKRLYDDD